MEKTPINLEEKKKLKEENTVVLDYSFPSGYPEFADFYITPEEKEGNITAFDMKKVLHWYHGDYIKGRVNGEMLLMYLRYNYLLEDSIGLPELGGIYKKGSIFFEKNFGDNAVFAWRSILSLPRGRYIPYLIKFGGPVVLCLYWLGALWHPNFITLFHTKDSRITSISHEEEVPLSSNIFTFTGKPRP